MRAKSRRIRKLSSPRPLRRQMLENVRIFSATLHSGTHDTTKNLSIHFPEGSVITLQFRLTRPETDSQVSDSYIYRLTDIGLGLEMVKLEPEVIHSIKNDLKSVSLRHTS
jgi:hypothetical protein